MTEEEYFRKNYPDSCYGDKPLSPHWDFFQSGVDFGERQSEKRIADLESQIEQMKCCQNCKHSRTEYEHCRTNKHEKWEIKEND